MNTTVVIKDTKKPVLTTDLLNNSQDSVTSIVKDFNQNFRNKQETETFNFKPVQRKFKKVNSLKLIQN